MKAYLIPDRSALGSTLLPLFKGHAMIFATDTAGNCLHVSQEWSALTSQPIDQALGIGWTSRVHPDDVKTVRLVLEQAAASASEFSLRYRLLLADGRPCWVMAGCIPSFGPPETTFLGYLGSLTKLAEGGTSGMTAYGNAGRYVPSPPNDMTAHGDHLDRIADQLIQTHALIEAGGMHAALPGVRIALLAVGRALAQRAPKSRIVN